jgi:hypothetical protein
MDRLLTSKERAEILTRYQCTFTGMKLRTMMLRAQDEKTAAAKDAEWDIKCAKEKEEFGASVLEATWSQVTSEYKAKMAEIFRVIEKHKVLANSYIPKSITEEVWYQTLKSKYLKGDK